MARRRDEPHTHPCVNANAGCTNLIECHTPYELDHHGDTDEDWFAYCPANDGSLECADCAESRCADCGCVVRLEGHDPECDVLCPVCKTNERPVSEHGPKYRYLTCLDCADDGREPSHGPSVQELYDRAWEQRRRLRQLDLHGGEG